MADPDSGTTGADYVITGGASEDAGSRPGNSGPERPAFSFASKFEGSGNKLEGGDSRFEGPATAEAPVTKKRRGRAPYPRDASGNIIRPSGVGPQGNKGDKIGLVKVVNDRASMKAQVSVFFQLAAQFTRMPHWLLTDQEATMEANAVCDLADSMGWDMSVKDSPIGAAVILAVTTFSIVKPRIDETVKIANAVNVSPTAPATPGEARQQQTRPNGGMGRMNFGDDIVAGVNNGDTMQ